jgi:hypothetical protein
MPTVPQDAWAQSVLPGRGQAGSTPEEQAYFNISANPADFGAQVGAAAEKLGATAEQAGNTLGQEAVARQQMVNRARVDDLFSNEYVPALAGLTNQFYSLKGQAAQDGFEGYVQKMKQLQTEYSAKLPNPMAQFEFDSTSKNWNAREMLRMGAHAAQQSDAFIARANNSMIAGLVTDGQNHYNDPQALAVNRNSIIYQAERFGADQHIDAKTTENSWRNALDQMYYGAISNQMQSDPEAAQKMLDQYGDIEHMSARSIADLRSKLQPKLAAKQEQDVYGYVYNAFGIGNPDSDINAATAAVMDPNQFGQLTNEQRNEIAHTLSAEWNRTRQVRNDQQKSVNETFEDGILTGAIDPKDVIGWKDPKTGLSPEAKTRENVLSNWLPKLQGLGTLKKSDPGVLTDLSDAVSDRFLVDRAPINDAYAKGRITEADWKNLRNTQDVMQDKSKTRWWSEVDQLYRSRYQDNKGYWSSDAARMLYPQFISNLDDAIREQNLKGHQVIEMANKMLEPIDKTIVDQSIGRGWYDPRGWLPDREGTQPALDFATQWGGWRKPLLNTANAPAAPAGAPQPAAPPATPQAAGGAPPARDAAGLEFVRKELGLADARLITDENVNHRYDQLKGWDPEFWKKLELKNESK